MVISVRLREERERLGLTQKEVATHVEMTSRVQVMYESGDRNPDTKYLASVARLGMDVLYILTGQRSAPVAPQALLPEGDRILLDNFHAAPAQVQAGIKTTLGAFAHQPNTGRAAKKRA
ncbi:helix-turn-helix transcriptional regulator [Limnohabitans sp.]|uniref:helix-turn-helix domain-containing protein n=1 Tax=Limnohabitans sp. TaxID=1907725 RepID=UPI00286F59B0|nr:helix-turn-helix transcriptional regulator [Limnohabitans sp.]